MEHFSKITNEVFVSSRINSSDEDTDVDDDETVDEDDATSWEHIDSSCFSSSLVSSERKSNSDEECRCCAFCCRCDGKNTVTYPEEKEAEEEENDEFKKSNDDWIHFEEEEIEEVHSTVTAVLFVTRHSCFNPARVGKKIRDK